MPRGIEDFDDLLDPRHLYDCYLAPELSKYVLEKIHREEKKMATRYSRNKYARIKNLKSEPLANLTSGSKKRKLGDEKAEASLLNPSVHVALPSPTPSLEVTAISPPMTRARGKSKVGMNVWDDPATALGCAHNVITSDELKSLSSVPSHELVSRHIHKLVQSLRIMMDYLSAEEKIVMSSSKAKSVEAECSKLKKDLIAAMNERNEANQKVKELTQSLRVEKALVIQKDKEIQAALLKTDEERENVIKKFKQSEEFSDLQFLQYFKGFELLHRWTMKHHSSAVDFSSLDFEKIDTEVLEDEAKELEEDESGVPEKDKAGEDKEEDGAVGDKVADEPPTLPS
nr:hypothetical protein CFP56_76368 [Quercus suber]POE62721.1 hypothetical protein CFP56_26481 [Quercus suber]